MYNCSKAQILPDDDLLRYVLDENALPGQVEEHVVSCPCCQQRLQSLLSINHTLLKNLYRLHCPDISLLARYAASLASPDEALTILYHSHYCPLCAKDLREMKFILNEEII